MCRNFSNELPNITFKPISESYESRKTRARRLLRQFNDPVTGYVTFLLSFANLTKFVKKRANVLLLEESNVTEPIVIASHKLKSVSSFRWLLDRNFQLHNLLIATLKYLFTNRLLNKDSVRLVSPTSSVGQRRFKN